MAPKDPDEHIVAYLLGELPEDECALIEERYLADEADFRRLLAIEAELYDSYARGSLPSERRLRFERHLLNSPKQLERLAFSQALRQAQSSHRRLLRPGTAWTLGIAASLLIAMAVWWTPWRRQAPETGAPVTGSRVPIVVAFVLGPGEARDGTAGEPTIDVPADTDLVRLTAQLDRDTYPSYHAVLRTPEGAELWREIGIRVQTGGLLRSVILEIPARTLVNGHCALTLSGEKPGGGSEDVADYSFRVRKTD